MSKSRFGFFSKPRMKYEPLDVIRTADELNRKIKEGATVKNDNGYQYDSTDLKPGDRVRAVSQLSGPARGYSTRPDPEGVVIRVDDSGTKLANALYAVLVELDNEIRQWFPVRRLTKIESEAEQAQRAQIAYFVKTTLIPSEWDGMSDLSQQRWLDVVREIKNPGSVVKPQPAKTTPVDVETLANLLETAYIKSNSNRTGWRAAAREAINAIGV